MPDENFEKRMEDWADHEAGLAPELRPTAEMVRLVEEKGKRRGFHFSFPRSSHVGVVLVSLSVIIITYISLFKPDLLMAPPPEQLAYVSQREVRMPKAPITTLETHPPEKGKGRGSRIHQLVEFQVHRGDPHRIEALDLRQGKFDPLTLTSQDSFRLLIKANQKRYLYIYQLIPTGEFQPLHPQIELQPMPANQKVFLPVKPNWFYLSGEPGKYCLFLITSPYRIIELEDLFDQYVEAFALAEGPVPDPTAPQTAASALESYILSIAASANPDLELWQLKLYLEE